MADAYPPDVPEQLALVAAKIEELRLRAKHPPLPFWTLTGMLGAWRELSDEIEGGYLLTIYDYANDLSVRHLLDEVAAVLPEGSVKTWVVREIASADARYREVTHEVARPIYGGVDGPWWYFRVPNRIEGELAEDLTKDGLIHG